jgi:hypothetical protein
MKNLSGQYDHAGPTEKGRTLWKSHAQKNKLLAPIRAKNVLFPFERES